MDASHEILYNGFPRAVGSTEEGQIRQHFVHSESEMDLWFDKLKDERNMYSSICRFRSDMRPILSDIPFDLDSPMKDSVFENGTSDSKKIKMMRDDPSLAEEVLGEVWSDAQKLSKKCLDENIPALSIFSGLGVHVHLLFKERTEPVKEKVSTSQWLIDDCGLNTHDIKIIPDTRRILRVPNSQRISEGEPTGTWCIPMTEVEILNNSVHDVLERTKKPKTIKYHNRYRPKNRPEMKVHDGYENISQDTVGTVPIQEDSLNIEFSDLEEEQVKECLAMPCVRERFFSANPDHEIRLTGAILLFQSGFTPKEVQDVISRIGWVDYKPDKTMSFLKQIYKKRYSEFSCNTLQSRGLCVHSPEFEKYGDEPKDCETYKWTSGEAQYGF